MKQWHETASIFDRVVRLAESGKRAAIATVVSISGSAYRRPGAKLLVEESGDTDGGVSGGCLEADVRGHALEILAGKEARLLHYDTGSDEETVWGFSLGCEGRIDVHVAPADPRLAAQALKMVNAREPFCIATRLPDGRPALNGQIAGESRVEGDTFLDVLRPPPRLAIFGAGDDARPLSRLAIEAGFDVTIFDHRPAWLTEARFPKPARLVLRRATEGLPELRFDLAVVQTHAMIHDRDWLAALLPLKLAYLGLLGPKARGEQVMKQLNAPLDSIYSPIGLDVGADGPEQVAISVVAELLAVHSGREPRHLRERKRGIHE